MTLGVCHMINGIIITIVVIFLIWLHVMQVKYSVTYFTPYKVVDKCSKFSSPFVKWLNTIVQDTE